MTQSETTSAAGGGETRMYEAGRITGHYSDPDGSPDVGYSVGLGDGKMLWIGEISEHLFAETGAAGADLGGSGGQWFVLFGQERGATQVLGKAMPGIDADALCTTIAAALAAPTAKGGTEAMRAALAPFADAWRACMEIGEQGAGYVQDDQDAWFSGNKGGGAHPLFKFGDLHRAAEALASPPPPAGAAGGETIWQAMTKRPRSRSKVVALSDDGSGAVMLYVHDEGAIDCEGFDFEWPDNRFDRWAYLPADVEFHCETGEEALTLPVEPPPAGAAGGGSGDLGALSAGADDE